MWSAVERVSGLEPLPAGGAPLLSSGAHLIVPRPTRTLSPLINSKSSDWEPYTRLQSPFTLPCLIYYKQVTNPTTFQGQGSHQGKDTAAGGRDPEVTLGRVQHNYQHLPKPYELDAALITLSLSVKGLRLSKVKWPDEIAHLKTGEPAWKPRMSECSPLRNMLRAYRVMRQKRPASQGVAVCRVLRVPQK